MGYTINGAILDVVYECPCCGHEGSFKCEAEEFVGNLFGLTALVCEECGYEMYDDETAEDYEDENEEDE